MAEDTVPGHLEGIRDQLRIDGRRLVAVEKSLSAGERRMTAIEEDLAKNTAATKRIETNTAALVELMQAFEGALKVLEGIGKFAKPVTAIAGAFVACGALWVACKHWLTTP